MFGAFAVVAAAAALVAPHKAADFTKLDTTVTMDDGAKIAITYYTPSGTPPATGWPAVMMFHGIGQTRNSFDISNWSANRVAETYLAPNGYAVLTFDARAHGQSGGLFSLDGPRELQDTINLFHWLTSRPNIDVHRIGAFGVSYGGGMVWLATVYGVPFAAIAVAATWTDLRAALEPQGLVRSGVIVGFSQAIPQSRYDPTLTSLLQDILSERDTPALRDFLAKRSVRTQLRGFNIPTLMLQGRRDFAFDADQAITAFRLLKGPKRLYLGDFGHQPATNPPSEFDYAAAEVRAWFDRFLKGIPNGIDKRPPVEIAPDPWRKPVPFKSLPKARPLTFAFRGRWTLSADGKVARTTARVRHLENFGAPIVKLSFATPTGYKHLVAVLSAITPSGSEIVVSDGGADTQTSGKRPRTVTIKLQNEITSIPAGSRLRVTLGARSTVQNLANLVYLIPVAEGSVGQIAKLTLKLPVLPKPVSP